MNVSTDVVHSNSPGTSQHQALKRRQMHVCAILYMILSIVSRRAQAIASMRHSNGRVMLTRRYAHAAATYDETQLLRDMLYRIRQVNQPLPPSCIEFAVDGVVLGLVTPSMTGILLDTTSAFEIDETEQVLTLSSTAGSTCESSFEGRRPCDRMA
jgi:hypothetical protein